MIRAAVVGGAGYAGGEVLRLLSGHPEVDVVQVTSERLAGKPVASVHPPLRGRTELRFSSRDALGEADVVFAAMSHGESSAEIDQLREAAPVVIDLGADFRLRDADDYPRWYGWAHPAPGCSAPRCTARRAAPRGDRTRRSSPPVDASRRRRSSVSPRSRAPGCSTRRSRWSSKRRSAHRRAARSRGTRPTTRIGAARSARTRRPATATPRRSVQELHLGAADHEVAFSATAVEAVRGVLVTAHAFLNADLDDRDLWRLYRSRYAAEPFVRIVKSRTGLHRSPSPKLLTGTNYCDVGFERDPHSRRVVVTAALDNLVKGSAGQAVQALNIRHGFPETLGLEFGGLYPI